MRARPSRGTERETCSAFIGPDRRFRALDALGCRTSDVGVTEPLAAFALDQQRADRQQRARAAAAPSPVLDEPAALAGDRREPGLRVDGDGEPDRLEQRQVARRVGVGDALLEAEALGVAVVGEDLGPRLAGRRHRASSRPSSVPSGRIDHLGGDDLVEQRPQPLDGEVERAGDQDRAVPEGAVLAHPPHARPGSSW